MSGALVPAERLRALTLRYQAAGIAGQMLDKAIGMESCRIQERIAAVRDAVTAVSDGAAARQLSKRVDDALGVPM